MNVKEYDELLSPQEHKLGFTLIRRPAMIYLFQKEVVVAAWEEQGFDLKELSAVIKCVVEST